MSIVDGVEAVAWSVRAFLHRRWEEDGAGSNDAASSTDRCTHASDVLLAALRSAYPAAGWRIAAGLEDPKDPSNANDLAFEVAGGLVWRGSWRDHYWVVSDAYALIVDVTADRFGHEDVVVTSSDDLRYFENVVPDAVRRHRTLWPDRSRDVEGLRREMSGRAPNGPRM